MEIESESWMCACARACHMRQPLSGQATSEAPSPRPNLVYRNSCVVACSIPSTRMGRGGECRSKRASERRKRARERVGAGTIEGWSEERRYERGVRPVVACHLLHRETQTTHGGGQRARKWVDSAGGLVTDRSYEIRHVRGSLGSGRVTAQHMLKG